MNPRLKDTGHGRHSVRSGVHKGESLRSSLPWRWESVYCWWRKFPGDVYGLVRHRLIKIEETPARQPVHGSSLLGRWGAWGCEPRRDRTYCGLDEGLCVILIGVNIVVFRLVGEM